MSLLDWFFGSSRDMQRDCPSGQYCNDPDCSQHSSKNSVPTRFGGGFRTTEKRKCSSGQYCNDPDCNEH